MDKVFHLLKAILCISTLLLSSSDGFSFPSSGRKGSSIASAVISQDEKTKEKEHLIEPAINDSYSQGIERSDSLVPLVEPVLDEAYSRYPVSRVRHLLTNLGMSQKKTILHDKSLSQSGGVWKSKILGRESYGVSAYLPDITTALTKAEAQGHLTNSWPQSVIDVLGPNSMIAADTGREDFQTARKIFSEALSAKTLIKHSLPDMQRHVDTQQEKWEQIADTEETTIFAKDVSSVTYSTILTSIFGADMLTKEEAAQIRKYTDIIAKGLFSFRINVPVVRKIPFLRRYSRAMLARQQLKQILLEKIVQRKQAIKNMKNDELDSSCMFDAFLMQDSLPEDEIIDFCVDNVILSIFAGYDTTASVTTNLILLLHDYATPDELEQIRSELDDFAIDADHTAGLLDSVPKLKSAVFESFRFRPVVGGTFRKTTQAVTIGKVQVPADATIQWSHLHGSRSPAMYDKPNNACPLRFLNANASSPPPFMFGYGKHMCPGQFLAQIEIILLMKAFLCNYDFHLEPNQNTEASLPFNAPKSGIKLKLTSRRR